MSETRKRRRVITEKRVRWATLLIFLLFAGMFGGGYVYAKYYSQSVQNGIAIASGVYFTANYAVASADENDFFESIVKTGYQGADTDFVFEVRNYENNMLFNENTVEIPYSIYFWLEGTTSEAVYTVEYGEELYTLNAGRENQVGFEGHVITGGRAATNKYTIKVDVADGVKHTSVPVYVEVKTDQGAVISSELRGKMIFTTSTQAESYIESQAFATSTNVSTDEEKFGEIQKMAELTYEIKTVGTVTGDNSTEELKLSWDSTVLEINMFDDAFLEWKGSVGDGDADRDVPYVDIETGWYYITVKVMPYSAESVGFFRGSQFSQKVTDMDTLHAYIEAEKYSDGNEGTE